MSQAFAARTEEIERGNRYPEFDVPDYAGLPSDESYEVELGAELTIEGMRLVSPWRRDIDPERTRRAVETVRGSTEFQKVEKGDPDRPRALGDLEAVAWTPPCESGQPGWTVDVWWLTSFDGRVGKGWSFLVDVEG